MKSLLFCVVFFGCAFSEVTVSSSERNAADIKRPITEKAMEVIVKIDDSIVNKTFDESDRDGFERINWTPSLLKLKERLNIIKVKRLLSHLEKREQSRITVIRYIDFNRRELLNPPSRILLSNDRKKDYQLENYFIFYLKTEPEQASLLLKQDPSVISCFYDKNSSPTELPTDDMNVFEQQWGLHNIGQTVNEVTGIDNIDIDCNEAWDITKGNNIIVAVTDTGVYMDHPDLYLNIWINQAELPQAFREEADIDNDGIVTFRDLNNDSAEMTAILDTWGLADSSEDANDYIDAFELIERFSDNTDSPEDAFDYPDDIVGRDFVGGDDIPEYDASDDDAASEDTGIHGTAVASIIAAGMNNNEGITGVAPEALIMVVRGRNSQAVQYADEMGADVINCSWSGSDNLASIELFENTIRNNLKTIVFSTGNIDEEHPYTNGLAYGNIIVPDIITVSNIDNQGHLDPTSVRGIRTDVTGPGMNIYAITAYDKDTGASQYGYHDGTSFAAPFISGICALIKENNPQLLPLQIKQLITQFTDNIEDPDNDGIEDNGFDPYTGHGLPKAFDALTYTENPPVCLITSPLVTNRVPHKRDAWNRVKGIMPINVILGDPFYVASLGWGYGEVDCWLDIAPGESPEASDWISITAKNITHNNKELTFYDFDQHPPGRYTLRLSAQSPFDTENIFEDRIQIDIKYACLQIEEGTVFKEDTINIKGIASGPETIFNFYCFEYRRPGQEEWIQFSDNFSTPIDFPDIEFNSPPEDYPVIGQEIPINQIPEGDVYLRLAVYDNNNELYDQDVVLVKKTPYATVEHNPVDFFEYGTLLVKQPDKNRWYTLNFLQNYSDPVVVFGPLSRNDTDPAMVRLKDVNPGSCKFQISEWNYQDGIHGEEKVSFIVMESGIHQLGSIHMEAKNIPGVANNIHPHWFSHNFPIDVKPVILTQVVSYEEPSAVVTRFTYHRSNFDNGRISPRLQEEEAEDNIHVPETVAVIAMEKGTVNTEKVRLVVSDDNYGKTGLYTTSRLETRSLLGHIQTMNNHDPAGLRFTELADRSIAVRIEEEQSLDDETDIIDTDETPPMSVTDRVGFVSLSATVEHRVFFLFDQALVSGLSDVEIDNRLIQYVEDMNAIFSQQTNRFFSYAPFDFEITDAPFPSDCPISLYVYDIDLFVWAKYKDANESKGGNVGCIVDETTMDMGAFGTYWPELYDRNAIIEDSGSPSFDDYHWQLRTIAHEWGHVLGVWPEYYNLDKVPDITGVEPIVDIDDTNGFDAYYGGDVYLDCYDRYYVFADPFWKAHLEYWCDPMLNEIKGNTICGLCSQNATHQEIIEAYHFSDLSVALFNDPCIQHQCQIYAENIKYVILDAETSLPIPDALIRRWRVNEHSDGSPAEATELPNLNSNNEGTAEEDSLFFGEDLGTSPIVIKVFKTGYEPQVKWVSHLDAQKEYYVNNSNTLVVTIKMEKVIINGNIDSTAAGSFHTLGLKSDGTVVATGKNIDGQCNVESWSNIVQVAAGEAHSVGLTSEGTVVAEGNNSSGQCNVDTWSDIKQIAAGFNFTLGLKFDGTVVSAGTNNVQQYKISTWTDIVQICGSYSAVGLKSNGTVVTTCESAYCDISGWTDIVQIDRGQVFTVGLTSSGTVVAVGTNNCGACNVDSWTDIKQIAAGYQHTIGLKTDGSVVASCGNDHSKCDLQEWEDIVQVSAGQDFSVGLKQNGTVVCKGDNYWGQCNVDSWK